VCPRHLSSDTIKFFVLLAALWRVKYGLESDDDIVAVARGWCADFLVMVLDTPEEDESGAWMCGLENAVRVGGELGAEALNLQYPNGLCFLQGLGGDKGVLAISDFNNDRIVVSSA